MDHIMGPIHEILSKQFQNVQFGKVEIWSGIAKNNSFNHQLYLVIICVAELTKMPCITSYMF